ncbi:hypothetical protein PGH26_07020 [Sporosarcina jeotgali]|uniref:Uncharacterized protein n=1 Tax=Sporosarcina jeotgali TaxID=3020056 RepID=A0ABZ0L0H5_9BACL|nr:hypothetical protein [Sporosarcina sp. B2O-1]WOV85682.1 hypothetical protein PGH26_07020 [Sporosarcina sp. B2O-1]
MTSISSSGFVFVGFVVLSFILLYFLKKIIPSFKVSVTFFLNALISFVITHMSGIGYIVFLYWALSIFFAVLGTAALVVEIILAVLDRKGISNHDEGV